MVADPMKADLTPLQSAFSRVMHAALTPFGLDINWRTRSLEGGGWSKWSPFIVRRRR